MNDLYEEHVSGRSQGDGIDSRRGQRRHSAFTLIELLVVVAIIALLLSILVPSFNSVLALARGLQCRSNLEQQGMGMQGYISVFQHYPGHCSRVRHSFAYAVWPTRIRHYADGEREIFYSPNRPEGFKWQMVKGHPGGNYATEQDAREWFYKVGEKMLNVHKVPFSYAYNDWGRWNCRTNPQRGLGGDMRSMIAVEELTASMVANPAEMIAIGESTTDGRWDFNMDPTQWWEYPGKVNNGGSNILFCDGHVEWYSQDELTNVNLNTAEGRRMSRMWNNHNRANYK